MVLTIINGPNLNLLGNRENSIYGDQTFESFLDYLMKKYTEIEFRYYQTNVEGELVSFIQEADTDCDGIVLNAGAYTHTSVAISDAISAVKTPVIEVHISNIMAREEFRHTSLISHVCAGTLYGFGIRGYELAVDAFIKEIIK